MGARFEELDWRPTRMGALSLRRRRDPALGIEVHEIKLDDDYLMSSLWTTGETALARLALSALPEDDLDIVVAGLGLGYTAHAALDDTRVRSLVVVEALTEIIEWHKTGLIPLGARLTSDPRCHLVEGDFFAMAGATYGLNTEGNRSRLHAVLVDIDHSPRHLLDPGHASFYHPASLRCLAEQLHPGGIFALWSNEPPDDGFHAVLSKVFDDVHAHIVEFPNHLQGGTAANTVYIARTQPLGRRA